MFNIRNEEHVERRVEASGRSFELLGKESSVGLMTGRFGFWVSYRRPAAVRADSSTTSIPVRDHVMIVRLGAALLFLISVARRFFNG